MIEADDPPSRALAEELGAIVAGLGHARRALATGDLQAVSGLWPQLQRCASRASMLDAAERDALTPSMLSVVDELERTIALFGAEHRELRQRLTQASRTIRAGTAYQRAGKR